jgi:hypothetical protein
MIKTEQAPTLTLPPVMVINSDEASYYLEACEDFKKAGQQDEYTLEKLQAQYEGLSQDDACNFNIYGFTLQGWLSLEAQMVKVAGYVEKLRSQIDYLEKKIQERQKIIKQREMILKNWVLISDESYLFSMTLKNHQSFDRWFFRFVV